MAVNALFVDFNSFFASVEEQEQPTLRGRPMAVLPVMTDSTCCIAATYEAKRFGIKTGTKASEARERCPGIILVEARPHIYVEYHHRLIEAVDACVPVTQVRCIDEMSCALRGRWRERETALGLARQIKERIATTIGPCLRSSIGIAPNTFLAKTASDMQKPDGLVVLEERDLPEALFGLKLRDFCGIGASREARLIECGITTVEQLCRARKTTLHRAWNGIEGDRMYALLRGEEVERPESNRCTVGHSHVLEPKYRTLPLAEAVLNRLLQKAAVRLRSLGYLAGGLGVSVKFLGHQRWGDEMRFRETQETLDFIRIFSALWQRCPRSMPPPLAVGVTLFSLNAVRNTTPSLPHMETSRLALDEAVDKLNLCYGKNTIYFGGAQSTLDSAPARIAFTHIPGIEKEHVDPSVPLAQSSLT
jgi:DNA polymerase-4